MIKKNNNLVYKSCKLFLKDIFSLKIMIICQLFFLDLCTKNYVLLSQTFDKPNVEYLKKVPSNKFYLLGPGDTLSLKVIKNSDLLQQTFTIDGEGLVYLDRLEKVYVAGLTIQELTNLLNKAYLEFIKAPDVELSIVSYRPVRVFIEGEVLNPGVFVLKGSDSPLSLTENLENENEFSSGIENNVFFPSIVDLVKLSGGITVNADLTKVSIVRTNNLSEGGGKIKTTVNLLKALEGIDGSQNIRILDGDRINIPYTSEPIIAQIKRSIKSSLNPKFIDIYVGGRVEKSGTLKINSTAVLTDAIYLAGGTKVLKGPVRFLRYNNDGSIDSRIFSYRKRAKRGSFKNPYLRDGDIVMVGKSGLNIANEVLSEITSPIQGLMSTYGFYKLLVD